MWPIESRPGVRTRTEDDDAAGHRGVTTARRGDDLAAKRLIASRARRRRRRGGREGDPITSTSEKPCSTGPPNSRSDKAVSSVNPEVRMVRLRV